MDKVGTTAVWIHLPELPIEYFNCEILREIGRMVGKPLKLDSSTALVTRGKYARICVEVDLNKPLLPKVRVGKHVQRIQYEGLYTVCFCCEVFGHREETCPFKTKEIFIEQNLNHTMKEHSGDCGATSTVPEMDSGGTKTANVGPIQETIVIEGKSESYGPWMLVKWRKSRKPNLNRK
ncbi:hypothetical protein REPUB_Repub17cG0044700 [Reevesia pubescens]